MTKTTKSTRPTNLARFSAPSVRSSPKVAKKKSTTTSLPTKTKRLKPVKRVPLGAAITSTVDPVRFGSVSENSMLYLREGTEKLISELQVAIATKESAKKSALEVLQSFSDLPVTSTMSEIRERVNTVVSALQNVFEAL